MGSLLPRLSAAFEDNDALLGKVKISNDISNRLLPSEIIFELTEECMQRSGDKVEAKIMALLEAGVSVESVYERVFTPIAKELGDRWLQDEISFVDVHLGVLKLQAVANLIQSTLPVNHTVSPITAAIAATPGDQHTFSAFLASDSLRRRGWQVTNLSGLSLEDWLAATLRESYKLIGLSLYLDSQFDTLCEAIKRLKDCAETPSSLVLVSGDFFKRNPDCVLQAGADAYVSTIEETCQFVNSRLAIHKPNGLSTEFSKQA